MAFSRAVKKEALVAAGRRCCLCQRFKGVRLEVHHVEPESEGGSSDFRNAMALCFDCHADVGHYNSRHPKGNRYSRDELRRHRERHYELIESGSLSPASDQEDWLYCRYLVCKSFSALSEIVKGDLGRTPVANPLLADTPALGEMRRLVQIQGANDRPSNVRGDWFPSTEEYFSSHSRVERARRQNDRASYFEVRRTVDENEIGTRVAPRDPLTQHLLAEGVPAREVCLALGYTEGCGDGGFQETYLTRPLWAAFLEVRNTGSSTVVLRGFNAVLDAPAKRYRSFGIQPDTPAFTPLPLAPVLPAQSVLLPLGVVLGPLTSDLPTSSSTEESDLGHGHYQQVERVDYSSLAQKCRLLGTAIWPSSITGKAGSSSFQQEVHSLDLSCMYVVDRYWAMGSCPFLFFRYQSGRLEYIRELFSETVGMRSCDEVTVPAGVRSVVVAELERERTYLETLSVNGQSLSVNVELRRGECWEAPVCCGDELQFVGWYSPELPGQQDPLHHSQRIRDFVGERCGCPTERGDGYRSRLTWGRGGRTGVSSYSAGEYGSRWSE